MKVMYKTRNYANKIVKVEIAKETNCYVTEKGQTRKQSKTGEFESYFETFDEAKESLVNAARVKVEVAELHLNAAKSKLEEAMSINED